jgi:hypothetical protein
MVATNNSGRSGSSGVQQHVGDEILDDTLPILRAVNRIPESD